jgi:hypothetical protein
MGIISTLLKLLIFNSIPKIGTNYLILQADYIFSLKMHNDILQFRPAMSFCCRLKYE